MSKEQVAKLIDKAVDSHDANDALKFSQAALNAANALCALKVAEAQESTTEIPTP